MRFTKHPDEVAKIGSAAAALPASAANGLQPQGPALLGRGSKIIGKMSFEGSLRIDGQVEGEITAGGHLAIGDSASVTAEIRADSVLIAGKLTGNITAAKRIEILAGANVKGNVSARALRVQEGAVFEGRCSLRSDGAREDRKADASPNGQPASQAAAPPERVAIAPNV